MNTIGVSANRLEILQIAKAVAEEKAIDQSIVIEAMQEAIEDNREEADDERVMQEAAQLHQAPRGPLQADRRHREGQALCGTPRPHAGGHGGPAEG